MAWVVICGLVEGQNGLKNMVDDENLTAFIIRYRCQNMYSWHITIVLLYSKNNYSFIEPRERKRRP
jgi:hypothetical protein